MAVRSRAAFLAWTRASIPWAVGPVCTSLVKYELVVSRERLVVTREADGVDLWLQDRRLQDVRRLSEEVLSKR